MLRLMPSLKKSIPALVALSVLASAGARADLQLPYIAQGKTQFIPQDNKAWWARYHILKNAQHSILASYFILSDDIFGESFLELLREKAQAGLEVKLMLDARGSFATTHGILTRALLRELIKAGVQVKVFNPFLDGGVTSNLVSSDHQKFLLVDDHWFMTGGRNISQEYFLDELDLPATYHDSDVLVDSTELAPHVREKYQEEFNSPRGVAVEATGTFGNIVNHVPRLQASLAAMEDRLFHVNNQLLQSTYDSHPEIVNWTWIREFQPFVPFQGPVQGYNYFTDVDEGELTTEQLNTPNAITLFANTSAVTSRRHEITDVLQQLIADSKEEILIENPYIVLQPETEASLVAAAHRGVKIIISTNGPRSGDSKMTEAAMIHDWKRIYAEMPGSVIFMDSGLRQVHSKVFVFDRKRALVGSFNLDALSDHINSEDALLVQSADFAGNVAYKILEETEMDAEQLTSQRGPDKIPGAGGAVRSLSGIYQLLAQGLRSLL